MKRLLITALVLVTSAGSAWAASAYDYKRYGVNPDELTNQQRLQIDNAINAGDKSFNEIKGRINGILKGPINRG